MKLMCTFTNFQQLDNTINDIVKNVKIIDSRLLVFQNQNKQGDYYCIYNMSNNAKIKNSISIHRNKLSQTFYTINVINYLKHDEQRAQINWNDYKKSIILYNKHLQSKIRIINLKLKKIIKNFK